MQKKSPTRAIKDFGATYRKLEDVLGSPPLLCSYTFPQTSAAWLALVWFYKCGMPSRVTSARCWGTCCFYSLLHFRSIFFWYVHVNMTLGFLLLCP